MLIYVALYYCEAWLCGVMFVSVVDNCCDLALVETRAGGCGTAWVAYEVADMWRCCCYCYCYSILDVLLEPN
jgi:hypothetical protein